MNRLLISLVLIFSSSLSYSQKIVGSLIDGNSKEPISYAHVYASQSKKGTISNERGEFELSGFLFDQDTLIITHIGYQSIRKVISKESSQSDFTFYLNPKAVILDEVSVFGVDVESIVQDAMKYLKNSPLKYGKAFYRQTSFKDSIAMEWIEAFYDIAYSVNGVEKIKIDQARFARRKYDTLNLFISHTNFSYLTLGNTIYSKKSDSNSSRLGKPFSEDFNKGYNFYLEKQYSINSNIYSIMRFEPSQEMFNPVNLHGKIVFNVTQNMLVQYIAEVNHSLGVDQLTGYTGSKEIEIKNSKHLFQFNFSQTTGEIELILVDYSYDFIQDSEIIPSKVSSMFIIYEQLDKSPKKLREPSLELENVSNFERAKYKPKFWKDNPVIKLTPEQEAIIGSFEKENAFGTYFK